MLILFVLLYILFKKDKLEHYNNMKLGLHSVYDSQGIGLYTDITPPCKRGDWSCRRFKCPKFNSPHTTCWKCDDVIFEPQNNFI